MMPDPALFLTLPATMVAVELVFGLRFRHVIRGWLADTQSSARLMRDKTMSDDEKQKKMAQASAAMLLGSLKLLVIIVLALAGFLTVIGVGISLLRLDTSLIETTLRGDFQIASLAVAVVWLWVRNRVFG